MTTEERLDRIEHWTAGIAEERRKDRAEYKALWRDTQRQLNEVGIRLVQLSEADASLEARIAQLAEESRAANKELQTANKELQDRIAALVSGFGEFIAKTVAGHRAKIGERLGVFSLIHSANATHQVLLVRPLAIV
jgi:predicted  nucleic acid-binding Zn-ribbon protein